MVKDYETVIIFKADLSEEDITAHTDKLKEIISADGGSMIEEDLWGKKRLAYPMRKSKYGFYCLLRYTTSGESIEKLERTLRLDESVLKSMTVLYDGAAGRKTPEEIKHEAEKAEKAEKLAASREAAARAGAGAGAGAETKEEGNADG